MCSYRQWIRWKMRRLTLFAVTLSVVVLVILNFWFSQRFSLVNMESMVRHKVSSILHFRSENKNNDQYNQLSSLVDSSKSKVKDCFIPSLKHRIQVSHNFSSSSPHDARTECKRIVPDMESCMKAKMLFSNQNPASCDVKEFYEICRLVKKLGSSLYHVRCSALMCNETYGVGSLSNQKGGDLEWQTFVSVRSLEGHLTQIIYSSTPHYGFVYLKCPLKDPTQDEYNFYNNYDNVFDSDFPRHSAIQLLILPIIPAKMTVSSHSVNINIVFIDSVSRSHFFRTLPKTVDKFNEINVNSSLYNLEVLDFQLFQSVRGRTFECFRALFAGEIDLETKPFAHLDMPPETLKLQNMFKPLQKLGYHVTWLEDLCWHWEWGLAKDLLAYHAGYTKSEAWKHFHDALRSAGIDTIGPTLASCDILESLFVNDPFQGPDAMCFKGRHFHEYAFEFLSLQQDVMSQNNQSYFSMYSSNVGHDKTGLRIQTFDSHLADYIGTLSKFDDTLTIVLADHGNTYGEYVGSVREGKIEMFNPSLFLILPKNVKAKLGKKQYESLIRNQDRLVTMLDVHSMLKSLTGISSISKPVYIVKPSSVTINYDLPITGLLETILANRTCDSIPRYQPNFCICQNYEQPIRNDTHQALIAEFALGQLNNRLQKQYMVFHSAEPRYLRRRKCQWLTGHLVRNVKRRLEKNDEMLTKMDIVVLNKQHKEELFLVAVQGTLRNSTSWTLVSFDRVSTYEIYRTCADKGVDLKLCICDTNNAIPSKESDGIVVTKHTIAQPKSFAGVETQLISLSNGQSTDKCVTLFVRKYSLGMSVEVENICDDWVYDLTFHFVKSNLILSFIGESFKLLLLPGEVKFIAVAVVQDDHSVWKCEFNVDYTVFRT